MKIRNPEKHIRSTETARVSHLQGKEVIKMRGYKPVPLTGLRAFDRSIDLAARHRQREFGLEKRRPPNPKQLIAIVYCGADQR